MTQADVAMNTGTQTTVKRPRGRPRKVTDGTQQTTRRTYETKKQREAREQAEVTAILERAQTLDTIQVTEPQLAHMLVEDALLVGYSEIGGNDKAGKTTLMHQLAQSFLSGEPLFGRLQVEPRDVLFLNLNESKDFFEVRYSNWPQLNYHKTLKVVHAWPTLEHGGLYGFELWSQEHPDSVILIDLTVDVVENSIRAMEKPLADFSHSHNVSIVGLTHMTEQQHKDPIRDMLGGSGRRGVTDSMIALRVIDYKKYLTEMTVRGRPGTDSRTYQMYYDPFHDCLSMEPNALALVTSERKRDIVRMLLLRPGIKAKEVAARLGRGEDTTRKYMYALAKLGVLVMHPDYTFEVSTVLKDRLNIAHPTI